MCTSPLGISCETTQVNFLLEFTISSSCLVMLFPGCYFALKAWNAQNAGAAAVLVADDKVESLITMDTPDEGKYSDLTQNITIPSALVDKTFGDNLKKVLARNEMVNINLDWRESLPHPDERVEYEFWTNSNDICGPKCDAQAEFKSNFKGVAQLLEKGGYTSFIPHYITWYCPQVATNHGNMVLYNSVFSLDIFTLCYVLGLVLMSTIFLATIWTPPE